MKKHYRHEHDCLNCGSDLQGKFCHNCGQENLEIKESFGHMLNHAVSDYFHFDHQFFHTLKPLLLKPGQLTIEYMAGRRGQYLHPVKMYIFISLVYFILLFKGDHNIIRTDDQTKKNSNSEIIDAVKKDIAKDSSLSAKQRDKLSQTVNHVAGKAEGVKVDSIHAPVTITRTGDDTDSTAELYNRSQSKLPAAKRDGFFDHFFKERTLLYEQKYGKEQAMEHFKEDVKHNAPKVMFVLLPLFALILKITFWKNRKYYVEHLIYSIHLHCFFFLFSGVILLIQRILPASWHSFSDLLTLFVTVYTVYYIYRSLRVVYQRSRWRTISKMTGIAVMYWAMAIICVIGMLMVTAVTA
ncbi:DUF3667 domain-containing protein [Mucilaginibacter mali]|uniref:DUF3667 domain-containing protein n=1 Tax=Mucilaginibacter mali TaxID=2740462 RepID=A0A7D4UCW8_9SPHI|nr:DUF3667 domain-containing protein [Mucilaginibacter mali]QKJ29859.1 DUF3667 domain-containing protein [Mucilaginibacter mali]